MLLLLCRVDWQANETKPREHTGLCGCRCCCCCWPCCRRCWHTPVASNAAAAAAAAACAWQRFGITRAIAHWCTFAYSAGIIISAIVIGVEELFEPL